MKLKFFRKDRHIHTNKSTWVHKAILSISLLIFNTALALDYTDKSTGVDFTYLKTRLSDDGIKSSLITEYFNHSEFTVIPELLKININQPSATASYQRFISSQSVNETAAFLDTNREIFNEIISGSKVDAEVIAAILQVESSLGAYKGKFPLINVFASLTLLNTSQLESAAPDFWEKTLSEYPPEEHDYIRSKVEKKARSKAEWAYKQLKILFEMTEKTEGRFDPLETKGSWAGAFGIPQFIPSSVEHYGTDGDADGVINICELNDSIASVANYLEKHGYRTDNAGKRRKAVWHYNHSYDYVDCVLTLADKVKAKRN